MIEPKPCYDGRHCGNEDLMEDLAAALDIAVKALRQYAAGKTWRHIAIEALEELEKTGLVETEEKTTFKRGDRIEYRGMTGTVRAVTHWLTPASIDARMDDGRLVYDLETHFNVATEPQQVEAA